MQSLAIPQHPVETTDQTFDSLGLSQPTVSHHLKVLTDAGLLEREQRGRWAYFRIVPERLELLRGALVTPVSEIHG